MRVAATLTAERLRDLLHYEPETGIFTWRVSRGHVAAGSVAGSIDDGGYRHIKVDDVSYLAHRLAWLYVTGTWPTNQIDHKNCVRDDDRFANLREATGSQNQKNTRIPRTNTSGFKGASFHKSTRLWQAQISHAGHRRHLGYFGTAADAHKAYCAAALELAPDFARFG